MKVKSKISDLLKQLNNGIYEKEEVIAKALLSSVAGESIFLLGAPGVAKSLVARRLKYAFKDGTTFEYLMNPFSTPEELFGPVSISKLKNEDKYERKTDHYLPSASIVFLDEIWKANPSIHNTLLTAINEKTYRNGTEEIQIPMKGFISASNELPNKNSGLEAIWDRLLMRLLVEGVKEEKNFNQMITRSIDKDGFEVEEKLKITDEDYKKWSLCIDAVKVPENVLNVIGFIRKYIQADNNKESNSENIITISDRRWQKIVRLLKASAFLNDRDTIDLMDCFLIKDCLWNEIEQKDKVARFVTAAIEKNGYTMNIDFNGIKAELKDLEEDIKDYSNSKLNNQRKKFWDDQIKIYNDKCEEFKFEIDYYKFNDLNHLRNNLFVESKYADIVETNIKKIEKEISTINLRIKEIQNSYKTVKVKTTAA